MLRSARAHRRVLRLSKLPQAGGHRSYDVRGDLALLAPLAAATAAIAAVAAAPGSRDSICSRRFLYLRYCCLLLCLGPQPGAVSRSRTRRARAVLRARERERCVRPVHRLRRRRRRRRLHPLRRIVGLLAAAAAAAHPATRTAGAVDLRAALHLAYLPRDCIFTLGDRDPVCMHGRCGGKGRCGRHALSVLHALTRPRRLLHLCLLLTLALGRTQYLRMVRYLPTTVATAATTAFLASAIVAATVAAVASALAAPTTPATTPAAPTQPDGAKPANVAVAVAEYAATRSGLLLAQLPSQRLPP
mmetsp:Transcript_29960/g.65538  ORF Transcript_29960/g.65538 Transcript_29960/m.65538 type:complete len:302 (-) Transcript_29960:352-1257(-)